MNFFCGESSINNYSLLKSQWDNYWAPQGKVTLQPFKRERDFNQVVQTDKNNIFLMSIWNFQSLSNRADLVPVLVGSVNESITQSRSLWSRKPLSNTAHLRGGVLATALSDEISRPMLNAMLGVEADELLTHMRLLKVPKDIDALMAVSFGVADAAICGEIASAALFKSNPRQQDHLNEIRRSKPYLRTVVVVPVAMREQFDWIIEALMAMAENEEGKICLNMMGFDAWRPLDINLTKEFMP